MWSPRCSEGVKVEVVSHGIRSMRTKPNNQPVDIDPEDLLLGTSPGQSIVLSLRPITTKRAIVSFVCKGAVMSYYSERVRTLSMTESN